jgi:hypothetical protein
MRRREILLSSLLFLLTIFIIVKMVPAHAEDSSDDSIAYPTPTDVTDFIETPYPTMTEMAYDESDPTAEPTQTPTPADPDSTPTSEEEPTPTAYSEVPSVSDTPTPQSVTTSPQPESPPIESVLTDAAPQTDEEIIPLSTDRSQTTAVQVTPLQCLPDTVEVISGITNPSTMLEVRFALRVIGGGMSDLSGNYSIPLYMGHEARGRHPVNVVKRYSGRVIQQVFCDIP